MSSLKLADIAGVLPQEWRWSAAAVRPSLAVMSDSDREEYLARLGLVLGLARRARRLTQEDAAEALGVSPASLSRWEKGQTGLSAWDLSRLVRLYGLGFDSELVLNPPASIVEIRRRVSRLAEAAGEAAAEARRRALAAVPPAVPEPDGPPPPRPSRSRPSSR